MPIIKFNPFTPSFKYVWYFGWHQEVKELIQNERILLFLFLDLVVSQVRWNNFGPRILGARDEGNNLHYHEDLILTYFVPISPLFQCLLIFVAIVELKGIKPISFNWCLSITPEVNLWFSVPPEINLWFSRIFKWFRKRPTIWNGLEWRGHRWKYEERYPTNTFLL